MSKIIGLAVIVFVGWGSYRLMNVLSADALAMAIGVLMGILAGIPTTLLALTGSRRHDGPQAGTQARYTVLADHRGPYVLDNATGATYAIVVPEYKQAISEYTGGGR